MEERICEVFSIVMGIGKEEIKDEATSDNLEVWDSLKHMDLILSLEDKFGIRFTDSEIVNMNSLVLIKQTIKEKLNV